MTHRIEEQYPGITINFVGLFDPVGSIGWAGQFKPTVRGTLSSKTQHAWQAIAKGENRQNFAATFIPGASYRWVATIPGTPGIVVRQHKSRQLDDPLQGTPSILTPKLLPPSYQRADDLFQSLGPPIQVARNRDFSLGQHLESIRKV